MTKKSNNVVYMVLVQPVKRTIYSARHLSYSPILTLMVSPPPTLCKSSNQRPTFIIQCEPFVRGGTRLSRDDHDLNH